MVGTLVLAASLLTQDPAFQLPTKTTGAITDLNYYRVAQTPMSATRPAHVTKEPKYKNVPRYAVLTFGDATAKPIAFALDEDAEVATVYVDSNANGDLSDDEPAKVWRRQEQPPERRAIAKIWLSYWYDGLVQASYGGKPETLGLKFYLYSKADLDRNKMEPVLLYYRDYYRSGSVDLGGKAYRAALVDDNTDGRYDSPADEKVRFPGDTLFLDLDGSGKFDSIERYPMTQPFNVGGTTYEVAKVDPSGGQIQLRKSERTVPARVPPASLKLGDNPPPFTFGRIGETPATTLDKLKGKVVLLDFWATWCAPCIAELPAVRKVYREYRDKGFEIVGVSLDQPGDGEKWSKFVRENEMPWLQVHDGDRAISKRYFVTSIPMTFLLDKEGKIVATDLRGEELATAVAKLVK